MNTQITYPETPAESAKCNSHIAEIRFDCMMKMFDLVTVHPCGVYRKDEEPHPQRFILCETFSLEDIKYKDAYQLGMEIKEAYKKLEQHMAEYKKNSERYD